MGIWRKKVKNHCSRSKTLEYKTGHCVFNHRWKSHTLLSAIWLASANTRAHRSWSIEINWASPPITRTDTTHILWQALKPNWLTESNFASTAHVSCETLQVDFSTSWLSFFVRLFTVSNYMSLAIRRTYFLWERLFWKCHFFISKFQCTFPEKSHKSSQYHLLKSLNTIF